MITDLSSSDVQDRIAPPTDLSPVRIAVVGLNFGGHIVDDLLRKPASDYCKLTTVCDLDASRANSAAARAGVPACTDLDELLADPTLEAIGLFTGPAGRAKLIRRIIRAGKHVMTTKPFERDVAAALEVLQEAGGLGRVVHLNSPSPVLPADLRQVLLWQEKYQLGRPVACRREVWASYREQADGNWYDNPELCPVAPIFRLGIYLINDMVQLLGEPETVQVMHSRLFTGRPTPDNAQLSIRFKNGVLGSVFASFCIDDGQFYSNSMVLNYQNGTIYRNMEPVLYGQGHALPHMSVVAKTGKEQTIIERAEPQDSSGAYQWRAFHQAIRTGSLANATTPTQIVAGIKIINAMARAEKSGSEERV